MEKSLKQTDWSSQSQDFQNQDLQNQQNTQNDIQSSGFNPSPKIAEYQFYLNCRMCGKGSPAKIVIEDDIGIDIASIVVNYKCACGTIIETEIFF